MMSMEKEVFLIQDDTDQSNREEIELSKEELQHVEELKKKYHLKLKHLLS